MTTLIKTNLPHLALVHFTLFSYFFFCSTGHLLICFIIYILTLSFPT